MSRFLLVVPPLVGHINPLVGVAAELAGRGHEVAWAGAADVVRPLAGDQARVFPCPYQEVQRPAELRGFAALKFLWESVLIPLARTMIPQVRAAVREFEPDVVVADQQAFAGAVVAGEFGIPWVTSASTSSELVDPLAGMSKVDEWVRARMRELQAGLDRDLRFSPDLVLAFTTEDLAGPVKHERCHFVGPSIAARRGGEDFPWHRLAAARPTVLVTLGTANRHAGGWFLDHCALALAGTEVQAVLVDPAGELADVAPNILVRRAVPQLLLLARADAVICHAGHNTVCESLSYGVPLVVAPIRDDQPIIARQVVDAGAGIRLKFSRTSPEQIRAAAHTVLHEPSYRLAARRIQHSFQQAGGSAAAARLLEGAARRENRK